jgi:DNA-binding beta-propeller fold protein YncE
MTKFTMAVLVSIAVLVPKAGSQPTQPLELIHTIPVPGLQDGDFDHFALDLQGQRLFLAAEANDVVEVFDIRANKLIHTITQVKTPHSMVYRADLQKLFVVDGGTAEVKIFDAVSYALVGHVKLEVDCDSMTYDPMTKYMYVVNGKLHSNAPYSFISIVDTTTERKLADIKVDSSYVEGMALEKSGERMFVNVTGNDAVEVIDWTKPAVIATWSIAEEAHNNAPMAYDEAHHRLFVLTRKPGKFIVLDSRSGKIVASLACVGLNDDAVYDPGSKRIYIAGTEFIDVFKQRNPDQYALIGHIPTAFRAKTAILVPQLNRYYLAVPHHGDKEAEVRVYKVTR